jgi:hypothetical protein
MCLLAYRTNGALFFMSNFLYWNTGEIMMNRSTYLLTLKLDSDHAVRQVTQRLIDDGLQVVRSFDLQTARSTHTNCTCPNHGTEICDCQMVVLLVYGKQGEPLTLVAHSQDGRTYFELVDTPQQRPQRVLKTAVLQALALEGFASFRRTNSINVT